MGWFDHMWCPCAATSELEALVTKVLLKVSKLEERVIKLGAREDAADARFVELIELVKAGSAAKDAEIARLRDELANADADALARVDAALAADSEGDADKKEAGNAALEELAAPPAEPEPENPPVDDGTRPPL